MKRVSVPPASEAARGGEDDEEAQHRVPARGRRAQRRRHVMGVQRRYATDRAGLRPGALTSAWVGGIAPHLPSYDHGLRPGGLRRPVALRRSAVVSRLLASEPAATLPRPA